jgi:hypothetical protein
MGYHVRCVYSGSNVTPSSVNSWCRWCQDSKLPAWMGTVYKWTTSPTFTISGHGTLMRALYSMRPFQRVQRSPYVRERRLYLALEIAHRVAWCTRAPHARVRTARVAQRVAKGTGRESGQMPRVQGTGGSITHAVRSTHECLDRMPRVGLWFPRSERRV